MKHTYPRILLVLVLLFLLFLGVGRRVRAAEDAPDASYLICQEEEEYRLYLRESGGSTLLSSGRQAQSLLDMLPVGARVTFDSVETGALTLGTDLTLDGVLRSSGTISVAGGKVVVDGLSLTFTGAADLRVKEGTLLLRAGSITAVGCVVRCDYSAGAVFEMEGGELISGTSPALYNLCGTCRITGGNITAAGACAIQNAATLALGGAPLIRGGGVSVVTDTPLTLRVGELPLAAPLTVRMNTRFVPGTLTEVAYRATSDAPSWVTLTDADGAAAELTYFDVCEKTGERAFLAVSLPFAVDFWRGQQLLSTQKVYAGDIPALPEPDARVGYTFRGWCTDAAGTDFYTPAPLTSDLTLYARDELLPPTFTLSGATFVFDGAAHRFAPDSVTHPLAEEGLFSYGWYKDGELLSTSAAYLSLRTVADSGNYSLTITFSHDGHSTTVSTPAVRVTVSPRVVSLPQIAPKSYTGTPLYPDIPASPYYTVSQEAGTSAGEYPVTFTLTDPDNSVFAEGEGESCILFFRITAAENAWLIPPLVHDGYAGGMLVTEGAARFGGVVFRYASSPDAPFTETLPDAPGTYYWVAEVASSSDYTGLSTAPAAFSLTENCVQSLRLLTPPDKTDYLALEFFRPDGITASATYADGTVRMLSATDLTFSYYRGDCLHAGDTSVLLSYDGVGAVCAVTVAKRTYDLSGFSFGDAALPYSGSWQTLSPAGALPVGADGIPLRCFVRGGGTDAGVYSVSLTFATESADYTLPAAMQATLTVLPCPLAVQWGDTSFVYDGQAHAPAATAVGVFGETLILSVEGGQIRAGEGYTARALCSDANYRLTGETVVFRIQKAVLDLSGAYWTGGENTYDGTPHTVLLQGLPAGVEVIGYTDNTATEAGDYTATATFSYDSENYLEPAPKRLLWHIYPASYDMSGVRFADVSAVYDGTEHYPALIGEMPTGADGISLTYRFSAGATHVSEGQVRVWISFATASRNYCVPADVSACVTVMPKRVAVLWTGGNFIYDGTPHLPTARAECPLTVTGEGTDAGEYLATAHPTTADYTLENPTYAFTVARRDNRWITPPAVSSLFDGETPSPLSAAEWGEAEYRYYIDSAATVAALLPLSPGTYYMQATVPTSQNYNALTSVPVAFTVIAVCPVGITVTFTAPVPAFTAVEDLPIDALLLYNNGREEALSPTLLSVSYPSGRMPRVSDSEATFSYGDFSVTVPLSVCRAELDLSRLAWVGLDTVYDGGEKTVGLTGLPAGVRVVEYRGAGVRDAGTYTVMAVLEYDRENYDEIPSPTATLTVRKCPLSPPALSPLTYSGEEQMPPLSLSPLYTATLSPVLHAGEYTLTLTLSDPANYCWATETGNTLSVTGTVRPYPLSVRVDDRILYIDWREADLSLTYASETAVPAEAGLVLWVEGNSILARCENPDYTVDFTPGILVRSSRLSPERARTLLLLLLGLLILLLLALLLWRRREVIACRIHMAYARRARRKAERSAAALSPEMHTRPAPFLPVLIPATEQTDPEWNDGSAPEATPEPEAEPEIAPAPAEVPVCPAPEAAPESEAEPETAPAPAKVPVCPVPEATPEPEAEPEIAPAPAEVPVCPAPKATPEPEAEPETARVPEDPPTSHTVRPERETDAASTPVDPLRADALITDALARDLVRRSEVVLYTTGNARGIINVDTLSREFAPGARVDVNILKEKNMIPYDTAYLKVLARGVLNKPLHVYASDFSLAAVKMIALTGGSSVRVRVEKPPRG